MYPFLLQILSQTTDLGWLVSWVGAPYRAALQPIEGIMLKHARLPVFSDFGEPCVAVIPFFLLSS